MHAPRQIRLLAAALAAAALAPACTPAYQRDERALVLTRSGEFGSAREQAQRTSVRDPADRSYMLDRVKVLQLALADGVPEAAEPIADRLYDFLRTQGVNAQNELPTFFFGEGNARVWKGEPFEQAMALTYIALLDGMNGDWGNVRASINNALFQVRDFSKAVKNGSGDDRQRVIAAAGDAPIEKLATPAPSDFEIGYALKAIAAGELGEREEQEESLALLVKVAPGLSGLADLIRARNFNTVLVVDYGTGPAKYRYGPDGALVAFRPTTRSDDRTLLAGVNGDRAGFPIVTDVNRLASDLRWNNLEDLRLAKSALGTGLIIGGGTVAAASDNRTAQAVGLGVLVAGLLSKATAGADTRHNEALPQRTYLALVNLGPGENQVELQVDGDPASRLVLAGLRAPEPADRAAQRATFVQLRYVRLPERSAPWATSGQVRYANDQTPAADGPTLFPFLLGGRCVRTPNEDVLSSYQRSGYLLGWTLNDLWDLYKAEGVAIAGLSAEGEIGRHVLEGGSWLYTPLAGTTGFARLYGTDHPAYVPRSAAVRAIAQSIAAGERSPLPPSRQPGLLPAAAAPRHRN